MNYELPNEGLTPLNEPEINYKKGYVLLYKSIKDHWIFEKSKSKSRFEAWLIMLLTVNYSSTKEIDGNKLFQCDRGQSTLSYPSWAKLFNWDKSKVKRFFTLLQSDGMITIENLQKTIRITICNYDDYQGRRTGSEPDVNRKRTVSEPDVNPIIIKEKKKKEKKQTKESPRVFYNNQLASLNGHNLAKNYRMFVSFIFGDNEIKQVFEGVLSIKDQLTFEQYVILFNKADKLGAKVSELIRGMENSPKYYTGKKSLYLTLNSWLNLRAKQK